jgi:cytochrome c peroxidase
MYIKIIKVIYVKWKSKFSSKHSGKPSSKVLTPQAARRGALLFMLPTRADGASCISCHRGDRFTDEQCHVLGMPQIGLGKGDGDTLTDDFGRFRVTGNDADLYAFRTPSLLNVTANGPWGHSGAYTTLEAAVRHHLNPLSGIFSIQNVELTDEEVSDLVEFLKTLTDLCVTDRTCRAPWIPDSTVADPDGLRPDAVDENLNPL